MQTLQILVAVADLGSLTAAAERLELTPSAVSKAVTRAEERLEVRLVQRTTRKVSLTDLGRAYVARGRRLPAEIDALERAASAGESVARAIADDRRALFASPSYLARNEPPKTVKDLAKQMTIIGSLHHVSLDVLARSIYRAFLAFPCEFTGRETVTEAEGRCRGHASISSSDWPRRATSRLRSRLCEEEEPGAEIPRL